MALAAVTIPGASSGKFPLLSTRQSKLAASQLSKNISQSAIAPVASADTISAGSLNVLIGIGGLDTISLAPEITRSHSARHGHMGQAPYMSLDTSSGAASFILAATGNQTLAGAGQYARATTQPSPSDSVAGALEAIATVFGAASAGSILAFDHRHPPAVPPANTVASVSGAAPDLLLGWSFDTPGYTVDLGSGNSAGGPRGTQLRDGTDVRFSSLSRHGAVEIILPKQS